MAKKVRLQKTVQEKDSLSKVVSKKFTTFTQPTVEEDTDTVEELFRIYDKLYLEIPLEGTLSHKQLIEESSKLIEVEKDNADVQPLLDEITNLRANLLESNETIEELQNEIDRLRFN